MLHKYLNINNGILRFLDQMVLRDFNGTQLGYYILYFTQVSHVIHH